MNTSTTEHAYVFVCTYGRGTEGTFIDFAAAHMFSLSHSQMDKYGDTTQHKLILDNLN